MKQMINTSAAPKPSGSYSQAIKAGSIVYLAGQIALSPETTKIVGDGDFKKQLDQIFKNMSAVAEAAGGSLAHIVKLTIYVTDIKNQPAVSEVMEGYFNEPYPARTVVEVSGLPLNVDVEVESVLVLGE